MKRYKLGQRRTKTDAHGNSAAMPDMIECENGEYIKYSEHEQLLESIGAGGVSGQRIAQQPASGDHIPDASNMMAQDADPCKLEAAQAQQCKHRFMWFGDQKKRRCADCCMIEPDAKEQQPVSGAGGLDERESFERECHKNVKAAGYDESNLNLARDGDGYIDVPIQSAWWAWQTRAALAQRDADKVDAERLDWIERNARIDPSMCGNHTYWPTSFNKTIRGTSLRAAIDAALSEGNK